MNHIYPFSEQTLQELAIKAKQYRELLHQYPELSGEEEQTSAFIAQTLKNIGITNIRIFPDFGVAAFIAGNSEAKNVVGIRAEMDALPIQEENQISFVSKYAGKMHACGHDVHMAILLALAELLHVHANILPMGVKLIFQPSEETLPGGALKMIENGVFNEPTVDLMLGIHVLPEMPAGTVGFKPGIYMASSDEIYLTIKGKGGHAAMPHLLNDPVMCAAHILTSLQQVISRRCPPDIPAVLSFGKFIANGRTNVIPDTVKIEGTFRTFNEEWRSKAHDIINNMVINTAKANEVEAHVEIIRGYPVLENDERLTLNIKQKVSTLLGDKNVELLPLRMTSDDFAHYSQIIPSCYFRIGAGTPGSDKILPLHTSKFDVHEDVYITGIKALAACVF